MNEEKTGRKLKKLKRLPLNWFSPGNHGSWVDVTQFYTTFDHYTLEGLLKDSSFVKEYAIGFSTTSNLHDPYVVVYVMFEFDGNLLWFSYKIEHILSVAELVDRS